jgi:hypothetical protein
MIVGIMGNARTGKDTMAAYLEKHYRFVRVGLADPLKRFCKEVYDFSDEQLWGNERDKPDGRFFRGVIDPSSLGGNYLTPRYALQTLGTEWGRNCYPNTWIDYGIRVALDLEKGYSRYDHKKGIEYTEKDVGEIGGVVFSDLRFLNEYLAVKEAGGKLIRIYRDGHEGRNLAGVQGHASEEEQRSLKDEQFDNIILNDSTLEDYYTIIDALMQSLNVRRFD